MDMMLLGETLFHKSGESTVRYHGYWMPAGGNDGVGAVETFLVTTASMYTVAVQTKSSEQADSSAAGIGSVVISSTTPDVYKFDLANAKDLVRYTVELTGGEPSNEGIHFQLCEPLWAPN